MDKFEQISDARALEEIRKSPGFFAILRLLRKKKDDLFADWATDKDMSKDFCKGVLYIIESFEGEIDETIENGRQLEQQDEESIRILRGRAVEGGGTGDLAL